MKKDKNELGAVSATEGDDVPCLVPTPELPHDATYEDCGDCVVQTHCEHWGRCLATCTPIDLAPMHCHHCANMAKRNQWLEQSYARELERQTVMTQNIIAAARKSLSQVGSVTPATHAEPADATRRSEAPKDSHDSVTPIRKPQRSA